MNGLSGVWQARTLEGEVRFLGDTSPLPLSVPLTAGATVQQLVNAWTVASSCIALHGKLHTPLSLDDAVVQISSLVASDDHVCHIAYKLQATAVHLGNAPTQGPSCLV